MVPSFKQNSKQHLGHTYYYTQLHFERVSKLDFIFCSAPSPIETKEKIAIRFSDVITFSLLVAATFSHDRQTEYFVVYHPAIN